MPAERLELEIRPGRVQTSIMHSKATKAAASRSQLVAPDAFVRRVLNLAVRRDFRELDFDLEARLAPQAGASFLAGHASDVGRACTCGSGGATRGPASAHDR